MKKFLLVPLALMFVLSSANLFALIDDSTDNINAVPEPASIVMMGAGLAGVAYLGWKRNKKK